MTFKLNHKQVKFIKSAVAPKDYPQVTLREKHVPEVAICGRSNVGKSTLFNHLFNNKNLAKTSSTPGKTQCLNFFHVGDNCTFADIPGYGFAKVAKKLKASWGKMVETYFEQRPSLTLMLFLLDIRRDPNEDDKKLLQWILHNNKAMILILTKVDKVSKNEVHARTKSILNQLQVENVHYVHYSAPKNVGRKPLLSMINDAINDELEE